MISKHLMNTQQINTLRGKNMVEALSPCEIRELFDHIDALEEILYETDESDFFGTQGWRQLFGLDNET